MRILVSEKLSAHKFKTPEGYLVCVDAVLSRTGNQTYQRHELYGDSCDKPDEEIELVRDEAEVFSDKALASFENKALCVNHPDEDVDSENHNHLSVGFVRDIKRGKDNGQDVMLGTLVITDQDAIDKVESGEYTELSCGYNCDIVEKDGKFMQTNIRGNHVALCQHGRAGNARIIDSTNDVQDEVQKYAVVAYLKNESGNRIFIASATSESDAKTKFLKHHPDAQVSSVSVATDNDIEFAKRKGSERFIDANYKETNMNDEYIEVRKTSDGKRIVQVGTTGRTYAEKDSSGVWWAKGKGITPKRLGNESDAFSYIKACATFGDAMNDADFSKKTKQGYDVVMLFRDGGRLHAIFKRANDYGVALGYDTTDGQWAQGMYDYPTAWKAVEALIHEKPNARRIIDSVEDEKETYDGFNYMIEQYKSRPDQLKAIKAKIESGEGLLGEEKQKLLSKINAYMTDSINDKEQWYFKGSMGEYEPIEILPMAFGGNGAFDKVAIRFKNTGKELVTTWNKLTKHHPLDAKDATWYYETSNSLKPGMKVRLESSGPWSTVEKVERIKDWLYRITIKAVDGKIFTSDFHANTLWEVPKNYHDSLKTFTVKYTKDNIAYVRKVKAETMQDAIAKVKEQIK